MSIATEHQSSTAVVQSFYDAIGRGDIEEVTRLCSPDVTVSVPGSSPLAGLYSGRDAAIGFLGKMQAAAAGTFRAQLRMVFENRDRAVAVHHGTAERGEKTLDVEAALLFEVAGDTIASIAIFQSEQDAWDDFFTE